MITTGPFNTCIKNGVYFSLGTNDRVFTGDLFYNFATREFQIRGIPAWNGEISHVLPKDEMGPVMLHLFIQSPLEVAVRDEAGKYVDLRFLQAKITTPFITWIEEYYSDKSVLQTILNTWEVVPNLLWRK